MSTYHLHIIYDVAGWAYYHRAQALAARAPADFRVTHGTQLPSLGSEKRMPDIVLLLHFFRCKEIAQQLKAAKTALVASINVGWPQYRELLPQILENCDAVLFNNENYYQSFIRTYGARSNCHQISNGVDTQIFHPISAIGQRPARVLWVGSKFAAENKGYEILLESEPGIRKLGFDLDLRLIDSTQAPYTLSEMAKWYNNGQILTVASATEGTPNPALEAAACGAVVVSTPVGNIPELVTDGVNGVIIERCAQSIVAGIAKAQTNLESLSAAMAPVIEKWSWDRRALDFFGLFRSIVN